MHPSIKEFDNEKSLVDALFVNIKFSKKITYSYFFIYIIKEMS